MKKLYILPFDHRGSFMKMFGISQLTPETIVQLADYKHIVYEGFLLSLEQGVPKQMGAILVDEQLGEQIHKEAREAGITRVLTTEKSGQDEFDFEYGEAFGQHIENLKPDYVKVLVRYNPAGDQQMNGRQISRLKLMSDFCHTNKYAFLFELLVPAVSSQLQECNGDQEVYDNTMRWRVMREAIAQLQGAGIEPDIWKLEGLADFEQMKSVIDQTRTDNRKDIGVVVLGRGESTEKVRQWLTVSAKIEGVVGFAVGRTVFKQPLTDFYQKKASREETAQKIADNYKEFVELFEAAGS